MFLRFFRSSFVSQYVAIILAGLLLWIRAFLEPPVLIAPAGPVPLYHVIFSLVSGFPLAAVILGFLLCLSSAFYLNFLLTKHEILSKNSSLAAFLFLILVSCYPVLLTLHPVTICLFILLLILEKIFDSYSHEEPLELAFSAGFLIGIGTMFYFPFIFFYGLILVGFILFRTTSFRDWISSLLGLCSPFTFLLVYYFWFDEAKTRILEFFRSFNPQFDKAIFRNTGLLVFFITQMILLVIGLFSGLSRISERTIEIRRKTTLTAWLAFFVLVSYPFSGTLLPFHLLISFLTISALISIYFLRLKKNFWQEIILVTAIIFVLINNLFRLFT